MAEPDLDAVETLRRRAVRANNAGFVFGLVGIATFWAGYLYGALTIGITVTLSVALGFFCTARIIWMIRLRRAKG